MNNTCSHASYSLVVAVHISCMFTKRFIAVVRFLLDIKVMECLSRTFEVKTVPLQVPFLGPDVSIRSLVPKPFRPLSKTSLQHQLCA